MRFDSATHAPTPLPAVYPLYPSPLQSKICTTDKWSSRYPPRVIKHVPFFIMSIPADQRITRWTDEGSKSPIPSRYLGRVVTVSRRHWLPDAEFLLGWRCVSLMEDKHWVAIQPVGTRNGPWSPGKRKWPRSPPVRQPNNVTRHVATAICGGDGLSLHVYCS